MIFYQIKSEKLLPKNIINNINKHLKQTDKKFILIFDMLKNETEKFLTQ